MVNNISISSKILNSRKTWLYLNLAVSLVLFLFIESFHIDEYNEVYLVYSFWQILVYGWLFFSELRYPGLNVIAVFFVGALMTVAIPSYSYATDMMNGDRAYCDVDYNEITHFVFRTATAMNIYYSLFMLLFTKFSRDKMFIIDIRSVAKRFNLFSLSIIVYLIASVLRVVPFLELISSTLAHLATSLPMLVLLLLAMYCGFSSRHDKYYTLFVTLIITEIIYNMFFGYYKGTIVRTAAMYVIYYYLYCRNNNIKLISFKTVGVAVMFMAFVLYIVYPFITIKRIESNYTASNDKTIITDVDNVDIMRRVLIGDYKIFDDNGTGNAIADRMSAISSNAFFYQDAYLHGHHSEMLTMSFKKMIPGFLWSGKPTGSSGMMAKNYIVYRSLDKDADSSAYVGLFASSYFYGGWLWVIIMCIINAWFVAFVMKTCFLHLGNLFSWIVLFFMIFSFMRCFEEMSDGGFSDNVMYLVYSLIIYFTSAFTVRKRNLGSVNHS